MSAESGGHTACIFCVDDLFMLLKQLQGVPEKPQKVLHMRNCESLTSESRSLHRGA